MHVYYSRENNSFMPKLCLTNSTIIKAFTWSQRKHETNALPCSPTTYGNVTELGSPIKVCEDFRSHRCRLSHGAWQLLENGFRPAVTPSLLCPALIPGREVHRTIRINAWYCNPARSASLSEHCTATNQSSSHVMGKSIAAYNQ